MTQLTYNEAFDPYHAAFRLMRLWEGCSLKEKTQFDMIRILDFYLLFPFRLQNMAFFSADRGWRRISRAYEDRIPYGQLPDDLSIFSRMEPFQRAAVTSLVRAGFLSSEAWASDQIQFTDAKLPPEVVRRCAERNATMQDVVDVLCSIRERYPLLGADGLKRRTGLLEYRYDSV